MHSLLLPLLASTVLSLPDLDPTAPVPLELAGQALERIEVRVSDHTPSSQDAVALARDPRGGVVLVWQSRRQESGTYGIYARRLDDRGRPVSGEVRINATTAGMQMNPSVTVDDQGGVWFAWQSFGQDGARWSAVARRFDARLEAAGPEVLVHPGGVADQGDLLVLPRAEGGARVLFTEQEGAQAVLRLATLDGTGRVVDAPRRVDDLEGQGVRTPAAELLDDGGLAVAWCGVGADGMPTGLWLRELDAAGEARGASLRLDGAGALEPVLATDADGRLAAAWFETLEEGHRVQLCVLERAEGSLRPAATALAIDAGGEGWVSGLELTARPDGWLLFHTRFADDGARAHGALLARELGPDGAPCSEPWRVTAAVQGHQRLTAARGTRRAFVDPTGLVGVAWDGDGGLGDGSGAHLTLLHGGEHVARGLEPLGPEGRDLLAASEGEGGEDDGAAARPHEPPTFDPRQREARPDEPPTVTYGTGDIDFLAITNTGWTPPDPHLAVGPEHIVVMTNGAISWFDKSGTQLFQDQIEGAGGFWGAQGAGGFVFDPEVLYDPHSGRFMAQAAERDGSQPYFLLAISDDSGAPGTWYRYRLNVQAAAGDTDIDSTNIAVDDQAIYLTADFFGPDKFLVYVIDKASVLNGGTPVVTSTVITGQQSMGVPVTYDAGAPAQYMVHAREFTTASVLDLWAVTDPLGSVQTQSTTVSVPSYSHPADPAQAGTTSRPELFEARFWSAVYRNGYLWATHHQGTPARQRWYQIDMNGWPTSGQQPFLVQSGEIDLGPDVYTFFGSLWVDAADNMGMVYARSSSSEFISMERTWRAAGDPAGTTRTPVSVIGSTSPETSGRWGDYSATSDDPAEPGRFWGHHEYRLASWRTRVAGWLVDTCVASTANYCQTSPNSVGAGATIQSAGSTSIAADDFVLQALGLPLQQVGIFYYGPDAIDVPFGNGRRCVGGTTQRLPIVQSDVFGFAFQPLDYDNPPTASGQIQAGSTWRFQFWYRDPAAGGAAFNLSDGLSATFCP